METAEPHQIVNFNPARFDLAAVHLAVLCADFGSLSAAAEKAHCSVSTASYRLSSVEGHFGIQIFSRERRGLKPTKAGQLFLRHGRAILAQVELLNNAIRVPDKQLAAQMTNMR